MAYESTKFSTLQVGPALDDSTFGNVGNVVLTQVGSFDSSSTTAVELFTLPAGSRVLDVSLIGTVTGTNQTVDVGSSGTAGYLADELPVYQVGSAVAGQTAGAGLGVILSSALTVYGKAGSTPSSSGDATVAVVYEMIPGSVTDPSSY